MIGINNNTSYQYILKNITQISWTEYDLNFILNKKYG